MAATLKDEVRDFWTRYPCAKNLINRIEIDDEFFRMHDRIIDKLTPYHYQVYQYDTHRNERVLEIGCGMGAHAWRFAIYARQFYAIDLSSMAVLMTKKRFELYNIKGAHIQQADAENLPFADNFFDYVYSNGVIHHTPNTQKAVSEIWRVLKPGGKATVMMYHKNSIFYWFDLMVLGNLKYSLLKIMPDKLVNCLFRDNASALELKSALNRTAWNKVAEAVLCYTDGHFNPHTKVYTIKEARNLFSQFTKIVIELHSSANRYLERLRLIDRFSGWGLYVFVTK